MRILVILLILGLLAQVFAVKSPVDYVNTLGGTQSSYDFSHGSTLPLIARPWGFNTWAPFTSGDSGSWWFHPSHNRFYGIRLTHQPSPWIGDYGNLVLKASIPGGKTKDNDMSGYNPNGENTVFSPYYFKTELLAYGTETEGTTLEFTSTRHAGIMKTTFPHVTEGAENIGFDQTRRITLVLNGPQDSSTLSNTKLFPSTHPYSSTLSFSGVTTHSSGGTPNGLNMYYVCVLMEEGEKEGDVETPITASIGNYSDSSYIWVDLSPRSQRPAASPSDSLRRVVVRMATSLISQEQAVLNLLNELPSDRSFDSIVQDSKDEWNSLLSRIDIQSLSSSYSEQEQSNLLTTFYSCLFRASLFPRKLSEINEKGEEVHWSPYNNQVLPGPLSTDQGFWDAYSTVYPLLSLYSRERLGSSIEGWLNAYREGGWLPTWSSPGWRGSMVGTMGDVSLADAIVNDIPGFDPSVAYEAIRKDAFDFSTNSDVGRGCLKEYLTLGYVPSLSCSEAVSRTLNYLQSDFAVAQAAKKLNKTSDMLSLLNRVEKGSFLLFDDGLTSTSTTKNNNDKNRVHGFFRGKYLDGTWTKDFDQFSWGGEYTEGGPWQFRFYMPYDPKGLAKKFSSSGLDMCSELKRGMEMKSTFHIGHYGSEIHEQTEMTQVWGQYAHNNQPVHHQLYMFGAMDEMGYQGPCASLGQAYLRKAQLTLYKPTPDMFPGDEDNGEMASWFVLSSLGLYSLSPGEGKYVFGSPLFEKVVIRGDSSSSSSSSSFSSSSLSSHLRGASSSSSKSLSSFLTNDLTILAKNNSPDHPYIQSILWNGKEIEKGMNSIPFNDLRNGGELMFMMGPNPFTNNDNHGK